MSRIHGRNTTPELILRASLRRLGVQNYRISNKLPGRPDIIFPGDRIAVFVDGCFWHKCARCYREPDTRREFWNLKIGANVERDKVVNEKLEKLGWKVIRVWEHEITEDSKAVAQKIAKNVRNSDYK